MIPFDDDGVSDDLDDTCAAGDFEVVAECPYCDGTGDDDLIRGSECPYCNGDGWY